MKKPRLRGFALGARIDARTVEADGATECADVRTVPGEPEERIEEGVHRFVELLEFTHCPDDRARGEGLSEGDHLVLTGGTLKT